MKCIITTSLLALLLVATNQVRAGPTDFQVLGSGTRRCGEILTYARKDKQLRNFFESWISGYITGAREAYATRDVVTDEPPVDNIFRAVWATCDHYPQLELANAASIVLSALHPRPKEGAGRVHK